MTSNYTPGPWKFTGVYVEAEGSVVADVWSPLLCVDEQGEANGNLIAAAPELLEALKKAAAVAASPESFDLDAVLEDFQRLIALAERGSR